MSEAQQRIIEAITADREAIKKCTADYTDFADYNLSEIYKAAQELDKENEVVDVVTLSKRLEQNTGQNWFTVLVAHAKNHLRTDDKVLETCCDYIKNEKTQRELKSIAQEILEREESNIDDVMKKVIALTISKRKYDYSLKEAIKKAIERIDEIRENKKSLGVDVGYTKIRELIGGFNKTDLIIIGARPAMGKTALMLNFALRANVPVGIISSEQGYEQIGQRMIAIRSKVTATEMRSGDLQDDSWPRMTNAVASLKDRQIFINDEPRITINDIARQARKWLNQFKIEALYVDYLQRIDVDGVSKNAAKHERIGEIAKGLKSLAKELDMPIIALAQVNRAVEDKKDPRPDMANLSDSSEIEKEADVIAFLYRDEVYNEDTPDKGVAELIFRKNRHGPLGTARLAWLGKCMSFEELSYGNGNA